MMKPSRLYTIVALLVICIGVVWWWYSQSSRSTAPDSPTVVQRSVTAPAVIDMSRLENDDEFQRLMQERKSEFGVRKGVDLIVKSSETLKIGDTTVSMNEIFEKIRLKKGGIVEKDIQRGISENNPDLQVYGVYLVQRGDNIWNIHFKFLREYFGNKGVTLSPVSDEPTRSGRSSGVGKLLKFSENMVYIYNLREKEFEADLNTLQPNSKIVIFNMREVFALLDQIDFQQVNHIQFDGETLWIPALQ